MGAGDRPGIALVGWFCVRMTRGVLGAVFFFCGEDVVGGGYAEGEKIYLWERGDAGAGFLGIGRDSGRGSS